MSEEHRRKIGASRMGDKNPAKRADVKEKIRQRTFRQLKEDGHPMLGRNHKIESRLKMSKAKKGKPLLKRRGENHPSWKGGLTSVNKTIRNSIEYKLWRISVFERDNYTCMWCYARSRKGEKVYLQADHIKPFALYPELRFAIDNGRTLCIDCHKKTDTYGVNKKYNNK